MKLIESPNNIPIVTGAYDQNTSRDLEKQFLDSYVPLSSLFPANIVRSQIYQKGVRLAYPILESITYYCSFGYLSSHYGGGISTIKTVFVTSRMRTTGRIYRKELIEAKQFVQDRVKNTYPSLARTGSRNRTRSWMRNESSFGLNKTFGRTDSTFFSCRNTFLYNDTFGFATSEIQKQPFIIAAIMYPIEYTYYLRMCVLFNEQPKANLLQCWICKLTDEQHQEIGLNQQIQKYFIKRAKADGIPIIEKSLEEMRLINIKQFGEKLTKGKTREIIKEFKSYVLQEDSI